MALPEGAPPSSDCAPIARIHSTKTAPVESCRGVISVVL